MTFESLFNAFTSDDVTASYDEDRANAPRVLTAVVAELNFALVATAVTTSLVTARAMLRPLAPQYSPLSYLPPEPALSSAAAMRVTGHGLPKSFKTALRTFHDALSPAKDLAFEIQAVTDLTPAASGKHWMALSGVWRRCAGAALKAGDAAHDVASSAGVGDDAHAGWAELRSLLLAVRDGQSPCVSPQGHIVFPNWADRRSSRRKSLGKPAWHCAGAHRHQVMLADISQTGFGLSDCHGISAGDPVAVEIASGRVLSGVAIWSQGNRAGVRFREPLSRTDTLLA